MFVLSDLGSFVTGQTVVADGGSIIRPSYLDADDLPVFVEENRVPAAGARLLTPMRPEASMKAVVYDRYGPPDVLRVEDVPTPTPAAGEVLVRVAATSINLSDWETLAGTPAYSRIGGLRTPRRRILGSDIAGRVEAVGDGVTAFKPGDDVYGDNLNLKGGFAEYAVAPASALAVKPAELSFVEASTVPQAGPIALQGTAGAGPGSRVLINGAGGGSGSFAIQLAKRLGAHVTGVDNAAKLEFMRSVGADAVVDYRHEDFTRTGPALRPHPRPGRPSLDVRLPPGVGHRRPLPMRRWHDTRSAARPDGRLRGRPRDRTAHGRAGGQGGPGALPAAHRPDRRR